MRVAGSCLCSGFVWRCVVCRVRVGSLGSVIRWVWVFRSRGRVWGSLWFAFAAVVFGFAVGAEPAVCGGVVWVLAGGAGVWGWGVVVVLVDHVRMLGQGVWTR